MKALSRWKLLPIVAVFLSLHACAPESSCSDGWCGTLVVSSPPVRSLVPALAYWDVDIGIADLLFAKLADLGPELNTVGDSGFVPKLSHFWTFEDPLTIAFSIDPRARWHNGTQVSAHDVAFTFDIYKDPAVNSPARSRLVNIESVTVRDSLTAVFRFSRFYLEQFFDAVHHMHILPHHILGAVAPEELRGHSFTQEPIGCGPYRLAAWTPGEAVDLQADSTYFLGRPGIRRVLWRTAAGPTAAIAELIANSADFTHTVVDPNDLERLGNESHLRVVEYPSNTYYHVGFNLRDPENPNRSHPVLGNRDLRRAIVTAVDRIALTTALVGESGLPCVGPVTPATWVWSADLHEGLPLDSASAVAAFQGLGWHDSDGDGVLDRNGRTLTLELIVSSVQSHVRAAVLLQGQLARFGVQLEIQELDGPAYQDRLSRGQFDARYGAIGQDPSPASIADWSESGFSAFNYGKYSNPEFTRLSEQAINASDKATALSNWNQALRLINEDAPAIWLYIPRKTAVVHARFENVSLRADQPWVSFPNWSVADSRLIERDLFTGH